MTSVGACRTLTYMNMTNEWKREVTHLLHKLWGHCKESPEYDKAAWGRLQTLLEQVPCQGPTKTAKSLQGPTAWERLASAGGSADDDEFPYRSSAVSLGVDGTTSLDFVELPAFVQLPDDGGIRVGGYDSDALFREIPETLSEPALVVHRKAAGGVRGKVRRA